MFSFSRCFFFVSYFNQSSTSLKLSITSLQQAGQFARMPFRCRSLSLFFSLSLSVVLFLGLVPSIRAPWQRFQFRDMQKRNPTAFGTGTRHLDTDNHTSSCLILPLHWRMTEISPTNIKILRWHSQIEQSCVLPVNEWCCCNIVGGNKHASFEVMMEKQHLCVMVTQDLCDWADVKTRRNHKRSCLWRYRKALQTNDLVEILYNKEHLTNDGWWDQAMNYAYLTNS